MCVVLWQPILHSLTGPHCLSCLPLSQTQVTRGVMYTKEEAEGKRLRNPFDTITEGIGINRLTHNFAQASVDMAFRGRLCFVSAVCVCFLSHRLRLVNTALHT